MNHLIYYKGQKAICPKCGGLIVTLKSDEIVLCCIDCNAYYRAVGFGQAEAELECEEVELKTC